ncbi:MAG: 6-phospho-beta-glucosidase [Clostridiales bacterium]|nr:6-phospho-beta-glucosidase [Clostridiales bacterium]
MKICVIGGGGGRSMFLAKSIAQRAQTLGIKELVFMDIDGDKLALFGGMARHVAAMLAPQMRFRLTTDARDALEGADYVITTLRVGGDKLRTQDEHIALDLGILGQETTGAAGFSFAMRSIPVLIDYCEQVRAYAKPGALVFNFTNPVGIVSQALRDKGYDFTYGICDAPSGMMHQFAGLYGVDVSRMEADLFGLNHLSWFHRITVDGQDITQDLLKREDARKRTDLRFFGADLLSYLGYVPNEYLYYYYYREKAVDNILRAGKTRGDIILDINQGMLAEMAGLNPDTEFDKALAIFSKWYGMREAQYMANETGVKRDTVWSFDPFKKDDGGYAGVALNFIDIQRSGRQGSMVLTVPNQGAVSFLNPGDTVEVTCDITKDSCLPRRFPEVPDHQQELITRVKYYERIGAQAILQRSRKLAVEALMWHPLVNSYSLAVSLCEQLIALNEPYTGPWGA